MNAHNLPFAASVGDSGTPAQMLGLVEITNVGPLPFIIVFVISSSCLVQIWHSNSSEKGLCQTQNQSQNPRKRRRITDNGPNMFTAPPCQLLSTNLKYNNEFNSKIGAPAYFRHGIRVHGQCRFHKSVYASKEMLAKTANVKDGILGSNITTHNGQADYAEFFAKLHTEENISPTDVVQLRSPEQKITKTIINGRGPTLVISTSPSICAGVPESPTDAANGRLCAFIGQVPIKCTGPIRCGDHLIASGKNDGCAVAAHPVFYIDDNVPEIIGVAMEDCAEGVHTVRYVFIYILVYMLVTH